MKKLSASLLGVGSSLTVTTRWFHVVVPFVVATMLALFRVPPEHWNILWAEDGAIFVTGAYSGDPLVIAQTFVGYLHVVPRIIAGITVATTPVTAVPLVMTLFAAVVAGAVATAVFLCARVRIRSVVVCGLLALQVAVLPIAGGEVAATVANVHWYLIFGAFWAALVVAPSRWMTVLQCVVVAAAILSDPLAALLVAPLVLARVIAIRPWRGRAHAVSWAFLGASLIQGVASVVATFVDRGRSPSSTRPNAVEFTETYSGRVVLNSLLGPTATTWLVGALGWVALVLAIVVLVALIAVVARRNARARVLVITLGLASICFAIVVFSLKWDSLAGVAAGAVTEGGRYLVVPILLLTSVYAVAADHFGWWLPVALFAAIVIVPGVVDYRVLDSRADAPAWQDSIDAAADRCIADPDTAMQGATIAPSWFTPVFVPCELLVASRSSN